MLAAAVKRLFPEAKIAIGPSIANGFYYDFDVEKAFTAEDLVKIEAEMKKIIKENPQIERFELPRNEALELMKDEPYKVELINELPEDEVISFYKMGDFTDLCAGPHVMSLKNIKAIKLIRSAGAYWKGDEKNKMLSRIYGTAFLKNADLEAHLASLEEAKKRDHNKLGRELGIFTTDEKVGQGLPLFMPKGAKLFQTLQRWTLEEAKKRDHNKLGRELGIFTTDEKVGQGLPLFMPKGAKLFQTLQRWIEDEEEKRGYVLTKTPFMSKNDLFVVGQGLPLFMPKGAKLFQTLQRWIEDEEEKRGYVLTKTPFMSKNDLFVASGHWSHYKDGMFVLGDDLQRWIEDEEEKRGYVLTKTPFMSKNDLFVASGHWSHYKDGMFVLGDEEKDAEVMALRPMTCPFQFTVYNAEQHSYRDLPIRYAETSTLFRKESSGEMHGLTRVRQFTLSEGHIICTPDQVESEFKEVIDLINYVMETLGISEDISYRFSKWDPTNTEKYINNPEAWEATQNQMRTILNHLNIDYVEAEGEAAFYGPKLDIQSKNVHGKEDTIITVQIDFALGERLGMSYIDKDGEKKIPFVIHRSSIGCYERTIATLIEKYAGAFPTWMAPVQAKVLPLSDKYADYADSVVRTLRSNGVRVEVDHRTEKIGYKIREARLGRVPYILVVGEKEAVNNEVSVRSRKNDDEGAIALDSFVERIKSEISNKER